jgi:hypothetical protein
MHLFCHKTKVKYALAIFCLWSGILLITTLWNTQNSKMSLVILNHSLLLMLIYCRQKNCSKVTRQLHATLRRDMFNLSFGMIQTFLPDVGEGSAQWVLATAPSAGWLKN